MKKCIVASLASVFGLFACSSEPEPQKDPGPLYQSTREVTTAATVESVDPAARKITLKGPEGNTITCSVDERVRNLDQVNPGDIVTLTYLESAAIDVARKSDRDDGDETIVERAPQGEKPEGKVVRQITRSAEIVNIDRSKGTVTVRGSDDALTTIWVKRPEKLDRLKVGDRLRITYREAVAVSVQPSSTDVK
jgi:hypothetical protein